MKHPSILVTGGTGSFGNAFVRRVLDEGAERVVVFSRDELKQSEMRARFSDDRLRFMIGDVRDRDRLTRAMYGVDLVVHAAAMKRIEVCEENPDECASTNIDGTRAVIDAVLFCEVPCAVFLSTDKAASPNTTYGASKLMAERLWTRANVYAAGKPTRFASTRYGNVLSSRGSVVELWQRRAAAGEPIEVTDPRMTRFWMTLGEAVGLVLMAADNMRSGEVYVPKVGASSLMTLAEAVAPGAPIELKGIRPGEKLHEMLISEDESRKTYDHGTHYTIEPNRTWEDAVTSMGAQPVPEGWSYRSDTALHQLTAMDLRRMLGC